MCKLTCYLCDLHLTDFYLMTEPVQGPENTHWIMQHTLQGAGGNSSGGYPFLEESHQRETIPTTKFLLTIVIENIFLFISFLCLMYSTEQINYQSEGKMELIGKAHQLFGDGLWPLLDELNTAVSGIQCINM